MKQASALAFSLVNYQTWEYYPNIFINKVGEHILDPFLQGGSWRHQEDHQSGTSY